MGELKKRRIIVLTSSNEVNCIYSCTIGNGIYNLYYIKYPWVGYFWRTQHLYVISDDEIKENDWSLNIRENSIALVQKDDVDFIKEVNENDELIFFKIIATTDTLNTGRKIMPDGEIFDPSSNWDLKYGVKSGFGLQRIQRDEFIPKIKREFVSIYMNLYNQGKYLTEILIDCDELKNNIVNIKLLKETFNLDDLIDAFLQCNHDLRMMRAGDIRDWIKKNL